MIEQEGAGEAQGGVQYAEVEFDSPTIGEVAGRYMVGFPFLPPPSLLPELRELCVGEGTGMTDGVGEGNRLQVYLLYWRLAGKRHSCRRGSRAWMR